MIDELLNKFFEVDFWRDVGVALTVTLIITIFGVLLRFLGPKVFNHILSIVTLGNKRLKQGVYQRISGLHHSGYGEQCSLHCI